MNPGIRKYTEIQRQAREDAKRHVDAELAKFEGWRTPEPAPVPFSWLERWYVLLILGIVAAALFAEALITGYNW